MKNIKNNNEEEFLIPLDPAIEKIIDDKFDALDKVMEENKKECESFLSELESAFPNVLPKN